MCLKNKKILINEYYTALWIKNNKLQIQCHTWHSKDITLYQLKELQIKRWNRKIREQKHIKPEHKPDFKRTYHYPKQGV